MYVCIMLDAGYDQLDHVYVFCICIMLDAWTMYLYLYQEDTLIIRRIMYDDMYQVDTWYASGRCIDDQEDHV
jgi:hypothetical protein